MANWPNGQGWTDWPTVKSWSKPLASITTITITLTMCTTRWQTGIAGRGGKEEEYLCCSRRISWLHARMLILNWLQTLLRDEASERASCMDMHMQDSCSHRARMPLPPPSFPLSVGTLQARTHFDGMTNVDRLLAADLNCRSRWETPSVSPASPARSVATRNDFPPPALVNHQQYG